MIRLAKQTIKMVRLAKFTTISIVLTHGNALSNYCFTTEICS